MVPAGCACLVTGGASGIGAAVAAALEARGADVLVADRDEPAPIRVDLSRPGAAARMVEEAVERLGRLDVLVNNAGGYDEPTYPANDDWRAPLELDLGHDWKLELGPRDGHWRLQGRMPRGQLSARLQPVAPG